MINLELKER
jgi:chromosome segregation ATPase